MMRFKSKSIVFLFAILLFSPINITAESLKNLLQGLVLTEFTLTDPNADVRVNKEGDVYRISFIGELTDQTIALLVVDNTNITGGAGARVESADETEIGLTDGLSAGHLLEWDGSNWVSMPPRSILI